MAEEHDKPELRTISDGRYRDLEYLGGGGMGTVYIATDGEMNRRVALKIARPERTLTEPEVGCRARFSSWSAEPRGHVGRLILEEIAK